MGNLIIWMVSAFLLSVSATSDHPIHLSVTEIYPDDAGMVAVSITFFMDDFGNAIHYDQYRDQLNSGEITVDDLIMTYLQEKTRIEVNGEPVQYRLLRKESNFPALTCYLKVSPDITDIQSLTVENTMMLELFDDQRNMVHVKLPQKKGSMILDKKKPRASTTF